MKLRNLLPESIVMGLVEMKKAKRDVALMKNTAISLVKESLLPYADRLDLDNLEVEGYKVARFTEIGDWSYFSVSVTNTNFTLFGDWSYFRVSVTNTNFTLFGDCNYLNKLTVYVDIREKS